MSEKEKSFQLNTITKQFHWTHWCVLFASFILTIFAWAIAKKGVEDKTSAAFDREATHIIELITERMKKYEDALWSGVALIDSQAQEMSHPQWKRFTQALEIDIKYPGVNGIGVIYYVTPEKLPEFLNKERRTQPSFHIHPQHNLNEYWPITYIEPIAINKEALGLDMAHEKNRFTAAKKARDTNQAQITGPITLVQDAGGTPGFLFFAPFYKKPNLINIDQRKENFIGLVYAPFIVKNLMKGTLQREKRHIGIKITDNDASLYDEHVSTIAAYDNNPLLTRQVTLDLYGRNWNVDLRSTLDFRNANRNFIPATILTFGLLTEFLLLFSFITLARSNKKVSAALQTSEKIHQIFVDASGDGFWDWYIKDDYEYMSPRFWEMLGYSPDEKPHKPSAWQDIIFEEDLIVALKNFDKHVETRGDYPYEQEVRYRHKDGSTVTVLCRGKVIEWDDDQLPVRMIGTHTDITELKDKNLALEKSLSFQKLLMDVNTDLVFVKDKALNIVQANPSFLNLYEENKRDSVIGSSTLGDYPADQADGFLAEDKKAFDEGFSESIETVDFPDGHQGTLLTKKLRFEDIKGDEFILGVSRDITQLKETEEALVKANSELEEFSYRTSHDLRSPLISSKKLLGIIQEAIKKGEMENAFRYIDIMQNSLGALEDLVSDILNLSRMNHNKTEKTSVLIKDIVDESLKKIAYLKGFDRITFDYDYEYDKPIEISQENLTLVLENLLSNTVKYQDFNKNQSKVLITTSLENRKLNLTITDNGLGIPERFQNKLFTMFKRFHSNTSFGSGLGLYMVKKSVDKMGGSIHYRDTGDGSQFTITLPI